MFGRLSYLTCVASAFVVGCFPTDQGAEPPLDELYFPTGMSLGAQNERLYVVNSDYDLAYNQGSLLAIDAAALRDKLPTPCSTDADCASGTCDTKGTKSRGPTYLCVGKRGSPCPGAEQTLTERFDAPGLCPPIDLTERGLLLDAARVAPFATDLAYVPFTDNKGKDRARLLITVRGDATLHWADVEVSPGKGQELDCGQGANPDCDERHRVGAEPERDGTQELLLPTEPIALATTREGTVAVVAHQTYGELSLFDNSGDVPRLRYVLDDLYPSLQSIAPIPVSRWAEQPDVDYQPGFLTTFHHRGRAPTIELVRYIDEDLAGDVGPYLEHTRSAPISPSSNGLDSRGIVVDGAQRTACEDGCDDTACATRGRSTECLECLQGCAQTPLSVYVANRSPSALLTGTTRPTSGLHPTDDLADLSELESLRGGVSRVYVGNVTDSAGRPARRVFLLAFDSQQLFVYDPLLRRTEVRIPTGRGPHALSIDEDRGLAYIAHFSDSNIGVIDIDQRHRTYGKYLLTVGKPIPVADFQ